MSKRDEKLDNTHFEISEARAAELKPISSTLYDMETIWDICADDVDVLVECSSIWDEHENVVTEEGAR